MPQVYNNVSKPANVPSVSGGALWADTVNKMMYLYGGEFQSSPQTFSMWSYDALYDKWANVNPDASQNGIQRSSYGGHAVAQDRGVAYWYGGWISNNSAPTWGDTPFALSSLLQYDMVRNTWSNSSGIDSIGRAEGVMVYLPASDGGMLAYFGGIQSVPGNATWSAQPLDTIFLYDIANAKWYSQKATGDIPGSRRRFCGGATWADDKSSYNIYIYGGASMPPLTVGYDDIYILSIPSFKWLKWYPDQPGTSYPHHSLSCDVIGRDQMIVMGGTFPNDTVCDVPTVFGLHNMDMGKQNKDNAKWASFNNTKQTYRVPSEVVAIVGGSGTGGATKTSPDNGFDQPDLSAYFTRFAAATPRTATRAISTATAQPKSGGASSVGPIVGGVVGGLAALIIVCVLVFCFLKRRGHGKTPTQEPVHHPAEPQWAPSPLQAQLQPAQGPQQLHTNEYVKPNVVELQGSHVMNGLPTPLHEKDSSAVYVKSVSPLSPSQSPPNMHAVGDFPPPQYSQAQHAHSPGPSPQTHGHYAWSPPTAYQELPAPIQVSPPANPSVPVTTDGHAANRTSGHD